MWLARSRPSAGWGVNWRNGASASNFGRTRRGRRSLLIAMIWGRLALGRKKEIEKVATETATQHAAALETSTQIRTSLHDLEAHLTMAKAKQRALIARHRATQARQALCRATGKPLGASLTPGAKLQRWNQRLTDLEDIVAAQIEVQGIADPEATLATWENEKRNRPRVGRIERRECATRTHLVSSGVILYANRCIAFQWRSLSVRIAILNLRRIAKSLRVPLSELFTCRSERGTFVSLKSRQSRCPNSTGTI